MLKNRRPESGHYTKKKKKKIKKKRKKKTNQAGGSRYPWRHSTIRPLLRKLYDNSFMQFTWQKSKSSFSYVSLRCLFIQNTLFTFGAQSFLQQINISNCLLQSNPIQFSLKAKTKEIDCSHNIPTEFSRHLPTQSWARIRFENLPNDPHASSHISLT